MNSLLVKPDLSMYEPGKNVKWHKSQAKKFFKDYKAGCEYAVKEVTSYYGYLTVSREDFCFTLMNAQHVYAKRLGFNSFVSLTDYLLTGKLIEGGLNAQT